MAKETKLKKEELEKELKRLKPIDIRVFGEKELKKFKPIDIKILAEKGRKPEKKPEIKLEPVKKEKLEKEEKFEEKIEKPEEGLEEKFRQKKFVPEMPVLQVKPPVLPIKERKQALEAQVSQAPSKKEEAGFGVSYVQQPKAEKYAQEYKVQTYAAEPQVFIDREREIIKADLTRKAPMSAEEARRVDIGAWQRGALRPAMAGEAAPVLAGRREEEVYQTYKAARRRKEKLPFEK